MNNTANEWKEPKQEIEHLRIYFTSGEHKTYDKREPVHELIYEQNGVHVVTGGMDNNGFFGKRDFYTYHTIKAIKCLTRNEEE